MSIEFTQTPGPLGDLYSSSGASHAARIPLSGTLVVTSGQPGFDLETGTLVTTSLEDEINACLNCVEKALVSAGVVNGLAGTHKLNCFLRDARYDPVLMEVWRARVPGHKPTFVTVGVASLAMSEMRVEIAAEAVIF